MIIRFYFYLKGMYFNKDYGRWFSLKKTKQTYFFLFKTFLLFVYFSPLVLAQKGEELSNSYQEHCGSESAQIQNSISSFKTMINNIKQTDQCQAIKNNMEQNIPSKKDIEKLLESRHWLRMIKRHKNELASIESQIIELQSNTIPPTEEIRKLNNKSRELKNKVRQFNSKLGLEHSEIAQKWQAYEAIIDNIDKYSSAISQANRNDCLEDKGVMAQTILSLTGLTGLAMGSTGVGLATTGGIKLLRNLFEIGDQYDTKNLDIAQLAIGLKCALNSLNQEHCDLVRKKNLLSKVDTEAKFCAECAPTGLDPNTTNLTNIFQQISTVSAEEQDAEDFVMEFFDPDTGGEQRESALQNLNALAKLVTGNQDFMSKHENPKDFSMRKAKNIINAITNTEEALQALNKTSSETNKSLFKTNMTTLMDLVSDPKNIKHFQKFISAYADYNDQKASNYSKSLSVEQMNSLNMQVVFSLFDLKERNMTNIRQKKSDVQTAFHTNQEKLQVFSNTFQDDATQVLEYMNNWDDAKEAKEDMCMALLGMAQISSKLQTQCKDKAIIHKGDFKITFKHLSQLPHEKRVCVVQDFFQCAESNNKKSLACQRAEQDYFVSPDLVAKLLAQFD